MSNPNDPKPTSSENPEKPDPTDAAKEAQRAGGGSSYEFQLPDDVRSYSDLPPIPQPDTGDTASQAALPPRPAATRPASGTFDFIDIDGELAALSNPDAPAPPAQPAPPAAPLLTPTPNAVVLPPVSATPVGPPKRPLLSTDIVIELPSEPRLTPTPNAADLPPDSQSIVDIATLFPTNDPPSSFVMSSAAAPAAPAAPSDSSVDMMPTVPVAFTMSSADFDLGPPEPTPSEQIPVGFAASTPDLSLFPSEEAGQRTVPEAFAASAPDFDPPTDAAPALPVPEAFAASSADIDLGELPDVPSAVPLSDTQNVADIGTPYKPADPSDPPSSFVLGQEEAPAPVRAPSDPSMSLLLPPPEIPATDPSFGSMGSSGSISVPDLDVLYPPPADPTAPPGSFAAGDNALPELELPGATGASDSTVGLGQIRPVAPSEAWLDSEIFQTARTEPDVAVPPAAGASDPTEGSDIFSGSRSAPAAPGEQSDVIAATAYSPPGPTEPGISSDRVRPSDIALTFDGPPGGSTMPDGGSGDLPMADELADAELPEDPASDAESIHDLPDPLRDPLFDSATLAETPDLPAKGRDDAADYGAIPTFSSDASSILADLTDPSVDLTGDSSSVRVESPGVDRTLTGSPAEGAFDLTVPDEPIPAGLFDDAVSEPTDWQQQSGSDLFENRTSSVDFDLLDGDATGVVEPVDADLTPDQPSLTSAPSSIFSGHQPPPGSDARAGTHEPTDPELDEAEFSANPALNDTEERPKDAIPTRRPSSGDFKLPETTTHRASSGDFELPGAAAGSTAPDDGAVDWDAVADDENATRGIPKDASLSAIMRELTDDSNETPTKDSLPVVPGADDVDDDGHPLVTVDYVAESAEAPAMVPPAAKKAPDRRDPGKGSSERPTKPAKADPAPGKVKPARGRAAADTGTGSGSAEVAGTDAGPHKRKRESRSLFTGVLLGGLIATGAAAGAYFGDLLPARGTAQGPKQPQQQQPPPPPVVAAGPDAQAAFVTGDIAKALELVKARTAETADEKATAGRVRVFANVHGVGGEADREQGRKELQEVIDATDKEPDAAKKAETVKRAVQATVDLGVSFEAAGEPEKARELFTTAKTKYPAHTAVFDALLDRMSAPPAPGTSFGAPRRLTPDEAERLLLSVTVLMANEAPKPEDAEEPGVYYWKAVKQADAKEYANAIKLINQAKAAHVKRAKALAGRGLNPLTDPLEQMFPRACDEMAASWKLMDQLYRHPTTADAFKKGTLSKALDGFADTDKALTSAKADAEKFQKEATVAKADYAKLDKELTALKDREKLYLIAAKADAAKLIEAIDARDRFEGQLKKANATIEAVAAELMKAKVLSEKWTPAELVAGVKTAAGFATGVDAARITKAEAAAKTATDKLEAEKKTHLKEVTALNEKYKDDAKALTEKFKEDAKTQAAAHETALKAEQAKTEEEKKKVTAQSLTFQKQLANAITPAQALDIWLPVLADLRRPADAEPALAIAARALASSVPGSEEEAKAQTTTGMALLLKNDLSGAKIQFQRAKSSPAYKAAAGKYWTKVADNGLDAIEDPLALYRVPVVIPPTDTRAATKALHAGITAYKRGRYDAAALALADAAKNDPADPVAWYYLGATRWAKGEEEQARKDINQGAEREKSSSVPGREVSAALAPIQGGVRDAIDKARP